MLIEQSPSSLLERPLEKTIKSSKKKSTAQTLFLIISLIAKIDAICNTFLKSILHHPELQKLEASWRSLKCIIQTCQTTKNLKIRILNLSWIELKRDVSKVIDITQSELFNKVYNEEFGMPGGKPFGVLIGDYQVQITNGSSDIEALKFISQVAAAAFTPFITGVHPASFGLNHFSELCQIQNIEQIFKSADYSQWHTLLKLDEARFVGLVLPEVLVRSPYDKQSVAKMGFLFHSSSCYQDDYLWGNACYTFATILINSFAESSWFINLRGTNEHHQGGLVNYLPDIYFSTDNGNIANKYNVSILITDYQENVLSQLGFIPLCQIKQSHLAIFYNNNSIQSPKQYDMPAATLNAKISTTLQYILCASRFAHYIKIIGRDKIGSFLTPTECENYLNNWLIKYVSTNDIPDIAQKLKYPLQDARVKIRQHPDKPDQYVCIIHLQPRMYLEQIKSSIVFVTELASITQ